MMRQIWKLLNQSWAYSIFRRVVGTDKMQGYLTNRWRRLTEGDRVLDIGCGTGEVLDILPKVDYVGLDYNADYIERAKERYGARGQFRLFDIGTDQVDDLGSFDLALAVGVLHHLTDEECIKLLTFAKRALKPGGTFFTVDGVYHEGQSWLSRWVVSRDRGRFVRDEAEYLRLAGQVFPIVEHELLQGMLNIPYSHMIMESRVQPEKTNPLPL